LRESLPSGIVPTRAGLVLPEQSRRDLSLEIWDFVLTLVYAS
jgi:hypothetical protein